MFRLWGLGLIVALLLAFIYCPAAFSEQITCPVASDTTLSSNAVNTLSPCVINASVSLTNNSVLFNELGGVLDIEGSLENNGTVVDRIAATIIINGTLDNNNGGLITNDSSSTITNNSLLNNNSGATLSNFGTLNGTGTVVNYGTVDNINTGTLSNEVFNLGGTIANGGGNVQFGNGSVILGGTLNNALVSGTLGITGPGTTATLDGSTGFGTVTIQGTYTSDVGTTTQLIGTINNQGNLQLNSASLSLVGDTALEGGGTVTLAGSAIAGTGSVPMLINANNTIQGWGTIGVVQGLMLNNLAAGVINANVSGQFLTVDAPLTNAGLMEATGGGILLIAGGQITNNGGTIAANGGNVQLNLVGVTGGTVAALNGGEVQLDGILQGVTVTASSGGTVQLQAGNVQGGTLSNISGTIETVSGGSVVLDGSTGFGAVTIQGTLDVGTRTRVLGTINNQGNLQINGTGIFPPALELLGNTTFQGGGTVTLANASIVEGASGLTLNNVDNTIQGSGEISVAGLLNQAAGTINANVAGQSLILDDGPVTNAGQLLSTGGGSLLLDLAAPLTNTGTVLVDSASTMHTEAAFTQTGGMTQIDGKLRADNGVNVSGGSVLGMGTIVGNVTLTGGTMQPGGLTPGTLTIAGNYSQSNATFNELIGTTGNGLLSITGTDSLGAGALLNIDLLAGFTPTLGETFVLMDFGGGTGTFANAPTNGFQFQMDGFNWTIAYNADDIVLDAGSAVTTTPEPSTTVLILTGLAALLAYSFFQKRTAATR